MYLNKLNKVNINSYTTPKKKKGVEKLSVEIPQDNTSIEKSPSNPSYWQNMAGVKPSFKGDATGFVPRIFDRQNLNFAYLYDEQAKIAELLLNIPERGKQMFEIKDIANFARRISLKDFEIAKKFLYIPERGENQFGLIDIGQLSGTKPENYEKARALAYIPERGKTSQFNGLDISFLSSLDPKYEENAKSFFFIPERKIQFDGVGICNLAKLTPEQIEVAKTLYNVPERDESSQFNGVEIAELAKLTPEELARAKTLFDYSPIIAGEHIAGMAKLSQENFDEAKKLLNNEYTKMTAYDFSTFANYTPELAGREIALSYIPERGENQFESGGIYTLAKLDPEKVDKYLYVKERGDNQLSYGAISTIAKMKPEHYARVDELLNVPERKDSQFSNTDITHLATLPEPEQYERAKEIFDVSSYGRNQFSGIQIWNLAKLEPAQFEQAKTLFYIPTLGDYQLDANNIIELSQLKPEILAQAKTLLPKLGAKEHSLDLTQIIRLSQLNSTHFSQANELLNSVESTINVDDIMKLSMVSPQKFKKIKKVFKASQEDKREFGFNQILELCKLNPERLQQAISLIPLRCGENKRQLASFEITDFAKLKPEQFAQANELFKLLQSNDNRFVVIKKLKNLANVTPDEFVRVKQLLYVEGRKDSQLSSEDILKLIKLEPQHYAKALNFLYLPQLGEFQLDGDAIETISLLGNFDDALENLHSQRQKVVSNIDLYINDDVDEDDDDFDDNDDDDCYYYGVDDDYDYEFMTKDIEDDDDDIDEEDLIEEINEFFDENISELIQLSAILDKESLDVLFRKRLNDVSEYCETISALDAKDIELLKDLITSCDIYGKPFLLTQRIEFIDLIYAYKQCGIDMGKIKQMVVSNCVNMDELNLDLFQAVMKRTNLKESEIESITQEKIKKWNMKYLHFLSAEMVKHEDNMELYSDFLRAANLFDFNSYIHDTSNIYGQANARTKAGFEYCGINYDKWVRPSKENEVEFNSKDKNTQQLAQIISQVEEDMNVLMKTPAKGLIKKQFPKFIKGDEFIVPQEYFNKIKLNEFLNQLVDTSEHGQLTNIWSRAEKNKNNPNNASTANTTLTVLSHLKQRIDDISTLKEGKSEKTFDLTIKMWDRNPQKDIFQGNYSTCCIGMDKGNGSAMFHYLMNTAFNMMEIVDNKTGQIIGNALCYFVTDNTDEPIFIIDNIEINNSSKPSDEVGIKLRDAIVKYAQNITKEVTGRDDISICMSNTYNDVSCDDINEEEKEISFLGNIAWTTIYLDMYGGWVDKDGLIDKCKLLKLK